jgi:hypothetical protein
VSFAKFERFGFWGLKFNLPPRAFSIHTSRARGDTLMNEELERFKRESEWISDKLKNKDGCKRQVLGSCKQRSSVLVGNLQVFGKAKDVSVLVAI